MTAIQTLFFPYSPNLNSMKEKGLSNLITLFNLFNNFERKARYNDQDAKKRNGKQIILFAILTDIILITFNKLNHCIQIHPAPFL